MNNYYRNINGQYGQPSYLTTFNKNLVINTNPHYSDPDFQNKEQTIFGKKEENLHYNLGKNKDDNPIYTMCYKL